MIDKVSDPHDLERFLVAQAQSFEAALAELSAGSKRGHWMWFIFPQMRSLGRSATAQFYGVGSLEEARAYLRHPVLGPRLAACTQAVLAAPAQRSLRAIFGSPDDLKFISCMSLFRLAAGGEAAGAIFQQALDRWCGGALDQGTVEALDRRD